MARYEAGETLASIARTYDCSPPAISYVVSRSRARKPADAPAPPASPSEPQLVKTPVAEAVRPAAEKPLLPGLIPSPSANRPLSAEAGPGSAASAPTNGNGAAHALPPRPQPPSPTPPGNADRRILHLSLGSPHNGNGNGNGSHPGPAAGADLHRLQAIDGERIVPAVRADLAVSGLAEKHSIAFAPRPQPETPPRRDAAAFIDQELRTRVDTDIAAFLAAFDAALEQDSQESRSALREATDRLLRAGARTRIELERLEARMPLPPRDNTMRAEPAWRHRSSD